jgi:hypothetical protein
MVSEDNTGMWLMLGDRTGVRLVLVDRSIGDLCRRGEFQNQDQNHSDLILYQSNCPLLTFCRVDNQHSTILTSSAAFGAVYLWLVMRILHKDNMHSHTLCINYLPHSACCPFIAGANLIGDNYNIVLALNLTDLNFDEE